MCTLNEIFEMFMLVCFAFAWPFSIAKSVRTKIVKGKSPAFIAVILSGYVFGILRKILIFDWVFYVYLFNTTLISTDLFLYFYYSRRERNQAAKQALELVIASDKNSSQSGTKSEKTVKMALSNASVELFIKYYVNEFHSKHPDIRLEISKLDEMDLEDQKQQDFVIAAKHCIPQSFKTIDLYKGTPSFVATKDFLKKHKVSNTMSVDQLFDLPVVMRNGAGSFTNLDKQLGLEAVPTTLVSVVSSDMVYHMTQSSDYIGFFSKEVIGLMKEIDKSDLVVLNIGDTVFRTFQYVFGYHGNLTESARTFIEGFSKFCESKFKLS